VQVELCGSPTYQSTSGLLDAFSIEDFPPLLEVSAGELPRYYGFFLSFLVFFPLFFLIPLFFCFFLLSFSLCL